MQNKVNQMEKEDKKEFTEEEKELIAKYGYEQFLDMEEYKKECPEDPYCNYYVRGWRDGSNEIGDWIWSHHS